MVENIHQVVLEATQALSRLDRCGDDLHDLRGATTRLAEVVLHLAEMVEAK